MTEKLYDKDAYLMTFEAEVLSCFSDKENKYAVVLDKTAFFPEGGGQKSDTGTLDSSNVFDVREKDGQIIHYTDFPLKTGTKVTGKIYKEERFRKMQNHSGEHIVSGLIHSIFGFDNVGFRLSDDVTVDINGELSSEDIERIEILANRAVYENVNINVCYPDSEALKDLSYRSKLDLTDNVRIVTIEGYDCCACCAPHVAHTGEIGIIKIISHERYKGGTRLHMVCGSDALIDYRIRYDSTRQIAVMLSVSHEDTFSAVMGLKNEIESLKSEKSELKLRLLKAKSELIRPFEKNICIFEDLDDAGFIRMLINDNISKCKGIFAVFWSKGNSYNYIIASNSIDLRIRSKEINSSLNGRGGGTSGMIQGCVSASEKYIFDYISNFT